MNESRKNLTVMGVRKKSKGKKGKKLAPAQCYLCGKVCQEPTIDHVPAWCLAPNIPQSEFIQLKACPGCNHPYNVQEERFRDYAANLAIAHTVLDPYDEEAVAAYQQDFRQNASAAAAYQKFLRRSQEETTRLGRPNRDLQRIIDHAGRALHITTDGKILGETWHVQATPEFYIHENFIKMARGIHYYHTKAVFTFGHHIYIYSITNLQFIDCVHCSPHLYYGKIGDFFEYTGGYEQSNPLWAVWAICLYGKIGAVVSFENEPRSNRILRSLHDIQQPGPHFYESTR